MADKRKMQDQIDDFLKKSVQQMLANDEKYQENYKKLQLLCEIYGNGRSVGPEVFNSQEQFEGWVLGWGARWIPDYDITSDDYWGTVSILSSEFQMEPYASRAYYAEKRADEWEKKKAVLQTKIAKTSNPRKIQKLKDKIAEGDELHKQDMETAALRKKAKACLEKDKHYFARAARDIKIAEKEAVKKVIQQNTEREEISELVYNVLEKYAEKNESRFYRYGK